MPHVRPATTTMINVSNGTDIGASATEANRSSALSTADHIVTTALSSTTGRRIRNSERVRASFSALKPLPNDRNPNGMTASSPHIKAMSIAALAAVVDPNKRRAANAPSDSRISMYTGVNAGVSEPATTLMTSCGMRKAISNASTASPVPNRYATASYFTIAVIFTTNEKAPTVRAAANIRRFTDP